MGKEPGFTERIMTVMFLRNSHSRVGQRWSTRRHIRRSLHAHIWFFRAAVFLSLKSINLRIVLRQKWMDGSFRSFSRLTREIWEEWLLSFHRLLSLRDGAEGELMAYGSAPVHSSWGTRIESKRNRGLWAYSMAHALRDGKLGWFDTTR
jgi:hypothetical protein